MFPQDFVLVYEENLEGKKTKHEDEKGKQWRSKFLKNLKKSGLEMEEVSNQIPFEP